MMVFDLDPGPPATSSTAAGSGFVAARLFEQLGLETFAKTSGSKGMQLYVPLNPTT